MRFIVTWEIDIEADNAREAAKLARSIQLNPHSIAVVFSVADEAGPGHLE
ncbi:MAG: hypothetical protein OEY58_19350 [Gammaproteobacteria bacterium]|nr:hypothetical protein [Gammaproteobacteria bacterium]